MQYATAANLDEPAKNLRSPGNHLAILHPEYDLVIAHQQRAFSQQPKGKIALPGSGRPQQEETDAGNINARRVYKHVRTPHPSRAATRP